MTYAMKSTLASLINARSIVAREVRQHNRPEDAAKLATLDATIAERRQNQTAPS